MDLIWVLQPFRSSKKSSDTDSMLASFVVVTNINGTLAQYSEGLEKIWGLDAPNKWINIQINYNNILYVCHYNLFFLTANLKAQESFLQYKQLKIRWEKLKY